MRQDQVICRALFLVLCLAIAACNRPSRPDAPTDADLGAEIRTGSRPTGPDNACWATDTTPAIIETVTDTIPHVASPDQDAGSRTEIRRTIVAPRTAIWFRAPCDADLSTEVVTSLQRALGVRGLYADVPSGVFDPATRAAIRAYQTPRGLNSDRLSLAAARSLGVVPADLGLPLVTGTPVE